MKSHPKLVFLNFVFLYILRDVWKRTTNKVHTPLSTVENVWLSLVIGFEVCYCHTVNLMSWADLSITSPTCELIHQITDMGLSESNYLFIYFLWQYNTEDPVGSKQSLPLPERWWCCKNMINFWKKQQMRNWPETRKLLVENNVEVIEQWDGIVGKL